MKESGPLVGAHDVFEGEYRERFRSLCRAHGEFINYERDRAGLDLGLHLTQSVQGGRRLTSTRIWFQLKGLHATTLSAAAFKGQRYISVRVSLDLLRFWYAAAEPVFLAVYVESVDTFLVESVGTIVDRQWGAAFLSPETFTAGQKEVSVRVGTNAELTHEFFAGVPRIVSTPFDGPTFRGRYLGHRLDPLRSILAVPSPETFVVIWKRVLALHDYRVTERLSIGIPGGQWEVSLGRMYSPLEWVLQITTEFGFSDSNGFRTDGSTQALQGDCIVCVCPEATFAPTPAECRAIVEAANRRGIDRVLVLQNGLDHSTFGKWVAAGRDYRVQCDTLLLPELSYCLLTTTAAYTEFREHVSWAIVNYLWSRPF